MRFLIGLVKQHQPEGTLRHQHWPKIKFLGFTNEMKLTMVDGVGRKAGFNAMPSVLCLLEFKTELETLKVTSPLLSKLTALASKLLILKLT